MSAQAVGQFRQVVGLAHLFDAEHVRANLGDHLEKRFLFRRRLRLIRLAVAVHREPVLDVVRGDDERVGVGGLRAQPGGGQKTDQRER